MGWVEVRVEQQRRPLAPRENLARALRSSLFIVFGESRGKGKLRTLVYAIVEE